MPRRVCQKRASKYGVPHVRVDDAGITHPDAMALQQSGEQLGEKNAFCAEVHEKDITPLVL